MKPTTRLSLRPPQVHPYCPKATPMITPSSSLDHPSLMATPSEGQALNYPIITLVALTLPLGNQIITL